MEPREFDQSQAFFNNPEDYYNELERLHNLFLADNYEENDDPIEFFDE